MQCVHIKNENLKRRQQLPTLQMSWLSFNVLRYGHKTFMLKMVLKLTSWVFLWSWCWDAAVNAGFESRPIFNPLLNKLWIPANWCTSAAPASAPLMSPCSAGTPSRGAGGLGGFPSFSAGRALARVRWGLGWGGRTFREAAGRQLCASIAQSSLPSTKQLQIKLRDLGLACELLFKEVKSLQGSLPCPSIAPAPGIYGIPDLLYAIYQERFLYPFSNQTV